MSDAGERAYRLLLRAFPQEVRDEVGDEMTAAFLRLMELEGGGWLHRSRLWVAAAWDAVRGGVMARLGRGGWSRAPGLDRGPGTVGNRMGGGGMGPWISDVRLAARTLSRRPVFLATAVVTLGLGIGANTAIFSVVDALLFRPLPYPEADRLVMPWAANRELGWSGTDVNLADAWDWRARSDAFEDLAVFDEIRPTVSVGDRPEVAMGIASTPNLLDVLGVAPAVGRGFTPADGAPDAAPVALVSDGFWDRMFGRDPGAVGSSLRIDGEPTTLVGVLPPDFAFLEEPRVDLILPLRTEPATARRGDHDMEAVARLAQGVDLDRALESVNRVALQLQEEHPEQNRGWTVEVEPIRREILGDVAGRVAPILMGAVAFILLMACINVANLLLARADARRAEIAVRTALGASRARIVRQLLVESGLLALGGGALGILLAYWGERAIVGGLPDTTPATLDFGLDGTVLLFALAVSALSAILFGLVPALRAARPEGALLSSGGRGGVRRRSRRVGGFLVVSQTALAVVLLVGAGVMTRSVVGMARQEMGFEVDGVLTARAAAPSWRYEGADEVRGFWDATLERVRALPGVEAAGTVHSIPLGGSNWGGTFMVEGDDPPPDAEGYPVRFEYVSPGYLAAMDIDVLRGRGFGESDGPDASRVALVNMAWTERFADGRDPLDLAVRASGAERTAVVVGVVEDNLARGVDRPPEPSIFFPIDAVPLRSRTLAVRTTGDPAALVPSLRRVLAEVDPEVPLQEPRTMRRVVDREVGGFRLLAQIMGGFALLSLVLGGVGIYGVTSYAVGRRTGEIGIRLAMGSDRSGVRRMVVREGMRRALLGLALGTGLAYLLSRALTSVLVGVSPTDPVSFGGALLLLLGIGLLGCYLPARRASSVDPVRALRAE